MNRVSALLVTALLLTPALATWGKTPVAVSPEEAGLSRERLDYLSGILKTHVKEKRLAGVTALIAHHGKIGYFESFGARDVDAGDPMHKDSIFGIASMTKPITSAAVMMLYEKALLSLNDPVSRYIPELGDMKVVVKGRDPKTGEPTHWLEPAKRDITIRDLLRHTFGLSSGYYGIADVDEKFGEMGAGRRDGTLEDFMKILGKMPLKYHPGTTWDYGRSTDVLGRLVEVISGTTFDRFLEEEIFRPLGMTDTGFHVPQTKIDRLSTTYGRNEDMTIRPLSSRRNRSREKPPTYLSGGGGLVSTAGDYFKFCQMMLNGGELDGLRILSRKTVELMTRSHLGDVPMGWGMKGFGFGLGFLIYPDPLLTDGLASEGTYSWGGAASTSFWIDPVEELIGILMIQIRPEARLYGGQFQRLTYRALGD
jgi:CubicO group peptidase (beta-lactamase class C family)